VATKPNAKQALVDCAMIGVISKPSQTVVVEEFFQLFKTPWEFYKEGRSYDVVVATTGDVPKVTSRLLVAYGTRNADFDAQAGIVGSVRLRCATLNYRGCGLPIYSEVLTFEQTGVAEACLTTGSRMVGIKIDSGDSVLLRIGYDLFGEIQFLLSVGQPVENAHIPTLEIHIAMLREWMIDAGIDFLEIPPVPAGHPFTVCLTHDIDFVGIRRHKFDHTMWGFLFRSTIGSAREFLRRRISLMRLCEAWKAAASLPLVYLGWAKDFWLCFDWYLQLERGLTPTYFFIPFKSRCGDHVAADHPRRRATAYDIGDVPDLISQLRGEGCEVGVHGIDSWHTVKGGREELSRVKSVTGESELGIRMHWLLHDENTYQVLEEAGYCYDSTAGYNETPGYRCGTTQVFRPLPARKLLELPMHIQDGALFLPSRLGLSECEAWKQCDTVITNAQRLGGVLTILWHDRSPAPERFWGEFYVKLVTYLKSLNVWFAGAGQVVAWFRSRRAVRFESVPSKDGVARIRLCAGGSYVTPPMRVVLYSTCPTEHNGAGTGRRTFVYAWDGSADIEFGLLADSGTPEPAVCPSQCSRE